MDETLTKKDIFDRLEEAFLFEWSWCKNNSQPYNHTAIVLIFDGTKEFTVNFGPSCKTKSLSNAFSPGEIYIEKIDCSQFRFYKVMDRYDLTEDKNRNKARDKIEEILEVFKDKEYHLFKCNCRNHVKTVIQTCIKLSQAMLREFNAEIQELIKEFDKEMDKVNQNDTAKVGGAGILSGVLIGGIAGFMLGLIATSGKTKKESEEE